MGQIIKGILGGFSGKVGTVIGGNWKGIDYMRSRAAKRNGVASQLQLEQRAKFGLMARFIYTMSDLLMVSFKRFAVLQTGINSAFSYNIANAITGTYPAYNIDYSLVLVSRGDMPNAGGPAAVATANSEVAFSWTDNSGSGKALPTDKCIAVAHCPALNTTIYRVGDNFREDEASLLKLDEFSGETVETWVGFISDNGRRVSNSIYTGQVLIS